MGGTINRRNWVGWVLVSAALAFSSVQVVSADARVDYLIKTLRTSDSFRVRVQSCLSLAATNTEPDVLGALQGALDDKHPAVRKAAALALKRHADPSSLAALKAHRKDRDPSARRAILEAISAIDGAGANAKYYVGIGQPGNKASASRSAIQHLRPALVREVRKINGVLIAPEKESNRQARKALSANKLTGYYVDSSLVSLEPSGAGVTAVVSVVLNTYPGRNMRAMLQGRATYPAGGMSEQSVQKALEGAVAGALRRLPQALAASDARASR